MSGSDRRQFLTNASGVILGGAISGGLTRSILPASASEVRVDPEMVRFRPEIEPVVQWIEQTPRETILTKATQELADGLPYRELLAALLLAGIRNIEPRPVGFKFHAVLVINSAHQLSLDSPQRDRLHPLLWALDDFKSSQEKDVDEGDWWLGPPHEPSIPSSTQASSLFQKSMENWDVEASDAAIAGLSRSAGASQVMENLWQYGARNYRNIGHHIIFTAQSFRVLQTVGFQHAEPVLRSLVYGILGGKKGEDSSYPFEENRELVKTVRKGWSMGKRDHTVSPAVVDLLRRADELEASKEIIKLMNEQVAPESLWDGIMLSAGELLINHPGILALHAWTSVNALRFAFRQSGKDETRLMMILQAASWITKYRMDIDGYSADRLVRIDHLELDEPGAIQTPETIFETLGQDRGRAMQEAFDYAKEGGSADGFMDVGRRLIFEKGTNAHDYKFSAAAFEEFVDVSPEWRPHLMAASLHNLRASTERDSPLTENIREAISTLSQ